MRAVDAAYVFENFWIKFFTSKLDFGVFVVYCLKGKRKKNYLCGRKNRFFCGYREILINNVPRK